MKSPAAANPTLLPSLFLAKLERRTPERTQQGHRAHRINLTASRLFLSVYEARNIGPAAACESLTPSAVSKRIHELELEFGVTLFMRHSKGMSPTADATELAQNLNAIFDRFELLEAELSEYARGDRGCIRIQANTVFIVQALSMVIADFLAAHPLLQVSGTATRRSATRLWRRWSRSSRGPRWAGDSSQHQHRSQDRLKNSTTGGQFFMSPGGQFLMSLDSRGSGARLKPSPPAPSPCRCVWLLKAGDSPGAMPSMPGMLGPRMWASTSPTRQPRCCSASARLTLTVDLPTPP
jgi:hypothetical protein